MSRNLYSPYIEINTEKCKGCHLCISFCTKRIIGQSPHINKSGYTPMIAIEEKASECTGCAACATICPDVAISVYRKMHSE